jgi:hypothetical protein
VIHFSVYVNGTFLCTGDAATCMAEAKAASMGNRRAVVTYDNTLDVKTFINGQEVTYHRDTLTRI